MKTVTYVIKENNIYVWIYSRKAGVFQYGYISGTQKNVLTYTYVYIIICVNRAEEIMFRKPQ